MGCRFMISPSSQHLSGHLGTAENCWILLLWVSFNDVCTFPWSHISALCGWIVENVLFIFSLVPAMKLVE